MPNTGFLISEDDRERARQEKLSSQVRNSILLNELEYVPNAGSVYDTLEITLYRESSARLKLPKLISDSIDVKKGIDIRINHTGDIIVLLPVESDGHMVMARKNTCTIFSVRLASKLREKGITLPAYYIVSVDETIKPDKDSKPVAGWVCRRKV